jgi:(E)-4-hydroxy-3-methylbut-2-enyl-diphosphate synthase
MASYTKQIKVGSVAVGGGAPVSVQSMCNTPTADAGATVRQIQELAAAGCDIVRVAVPDMDAARAISAIKEKSPLPVVADIHFDHRLAIEAAQRGADAIRINPGNIGSADRVAAVVRECRAHAIPIRIGVNGGSLEKELLDKYGLTAEALCISAMRHVEILEQLDFDDICISIKSSDVPLTAAAYKMLSQRTNYPLHLGVTETGTEYMGVIKSAAGIGSLLLDGIGDTLRVSLTAEPVREIKAGIAILKAVGLRKDGVNIISCPTCGRTQIDLISLAYQVEQRLASCEKNISVAVMGCIVNGPGEARHADFGVAGGKGEGVIFKKGEIVGKYPENRLLDELLNVINS